MLAAAAAAAAESLSERAGGMPLALAKGAKQRESGLQLISIQHLKGPPPRWLFPFSVRSARPWALRAWWQARWWTSRARARARWWAWRRCRWGHRGDRATVGQGRSIAGQVQPVESNAAWCAQGPAACKGAGLAALTASSSPTPSASPPTHQQHLRTRLLRLFPAL